MPTARLANGLGHVGEEEDRERGHPLGDRVPHDEREREDEEGARGVAGRDHDPAPDRPPADVSLGLGEGLGRAHATAATRRPPVAQWTSSRASPFTTIVMAKSTSAISISEER